MSATIHRLSENVIGKIAAGEVIERPASAVKELVENSLDAGAERIYVDIAAGGRQLIRVADDGAGMTAEDACLSVERHATSKMQSPSDLFDIDTLGFRGEALASIAAVSRLTIETCNGGEGEGTRIEVEGGVRTHLGAIARDSGTTVSARSLFFNTPARRKFLRHMDTEARYITQCVSQLAVAYPEVAFRVTHNDRVTLDLHSGDRAKRVSEVVAVEPDLLLHAASNIDAGAGGRISVEVLAGSPQICQRSRTRQYATVRQRPVYHRKLNSAVYEAYGSLLPHNAHPVFSLWLDVDPRTVDVNVHPTKKEVHFSSEGDLLKAVQSIVRQALDVPEASAFRAASGIGSTGERPAYGTSTGAAGHGRVLETPAEPFGPEHDTDLDQLSLSLLPPARLGTAESAGQALTPQEIDQLSSAADSAPMWQIHNKYIAAPTSDGIAIVDQHVAHERIRFEEVLEELNREQGTSQQLLLPLTLDVSPLEMIAFQDARHLFERIGFGAREFGPTSLIIDSIPSELRNWGDGAVFQEIVSDLIEENETRPTTREAVAASMACHTSIRAGDRLNQKEMRILIQRLLKAREPFSCPHGRPIIIRIPLSHLDRLFGRT